MLRIFFIVLLSFAQQILAQPAPNGLSAQIKENGILLSWKNNASFGDSLEGFELEYIPENSTNKIFTKFLGTSQLKNSTEYLLGLSLIKPYEYYTFRVRAIYKKNGTQKASNYTSELQCIFYYTLKLKSTNFLNELLTVTIDEKETNYGTIPAKISIDSQIRVGQVRFHYCGLSEDTTNRQRWVTSIITNNDSENYEAGKIKMDFNNEIGIVYYFEIIDKANNRIRTPVGYANLYFPKGIRVEGIRYGSTQKDYNLISIPLVLENINIKELFKTLGDYNPYQWRLFKINSGTDQHTEYSDNNPDWEKSSAYWLIIKEQPKDTTFFTTTAGKTFLPNNNKKIPYLPVTYFLKEGWNAVPNPFNYDVTLTNNVKSSSEVDSIVDFDILKTTQKYEARFYKPTYLRKQSMFFVRANKPDQWIQIGTKKHRHNGRIEQDYFELQFFDWKKLALLEKPNTENISVFPNPAQNQQQIIFQVQSLQNIQIELFDLFGNKIKNILSQQLFNEGQHQVFWQTHDLNNGLYLLRFQNETQTIHHKIAIQK